MASGSGVAVMATARSDAGASGTVSLAVDVSAPAVAVAVSVNGSVAVGAMVPVTVYVMVPPCAIESASLMAPLPLVGLQDEPADATQLQVTPVSAGNVSVTLVAKAPGVALSLTTVIVYVMGSPGIAGVVFVIVTARLG